MSQDLVIATPEHVEVTLEPAGVASRMAALLVDSIIVLALAFGVDRLTNAIVPAGLGSASCVKYPAENLYDQRSLTAIAREPFT